MIILCICVNMLLSNKCKVKLQCALGDRLYQRLLLTSAALGQLFSHKFIAARRNHFHVPPFVYTLCGIGWISHTGGWTSHAVKPSYKLFYC